MLVENDTFGFCSNCYYEFNSELLNEYNISFCPNCGKKLIEIFTITEFAEIIYKMIIGEKFPLNTYIDIGYNGYNIDLSFACFNVDYNNVFAVTTDCDGEIHALPVRKIRANKEYFINFFVETIVHIGGENGKIEIFSGQQFFA